MHRAYEQQRDCSNLASTRQKYQYTKDGTVGTFGAKYKSGETNDRERESIPNQFGRRSQFLL